MKRLAVAVTLLAACGGGGPKVGPRTTGSSGFADVATARALLEKYSPRGYAVITTYETLPLTFELAEGPYKFEPPTMTFEHYLEDGAYDLLPTKLSTCVHELGHGYGARMAFQLMVDRGEPHGDGGEAILVDGDPWLVRYTPTFPAEDMDPTFPSDARTFKYEVYVAGEHAAGSTQMYGAYGLLDEYAAYYLGNRTTFEMWPWVRDAAPASSALILQYGVEMDDLQRTFDEMTLFLLHYLKHAREHQPEVYDALVANADFKGALLAVHDAFAALAAQAAALEPDVWALARERGVVLDRNAEGRFVIDGNPQRTDDGMPGVRAHVASETYQSELAALR